MKVQLTGCHGPLVLLLLILPLARSQLQMFPGNYTINALTYYTVSITAMNLADFQAAGWTVLTLPTGNYDSSQLAASSSSIACTRVSNSFNCSNGFYSGALLQFNITGIVNPPSATGPFFEYTIFSASSTSTESQTTTTITFTPGSLSSCSVSFLPNNVRKVGTATLSVTPGNKIVQSGSIQVRFPKNWASTINTDAVINSTLLTCQAASASIGTNPICTLDTSSSVYSIVTVTGLFTANTSSTFSITINPVLSLPISYSSTEVSVTSRDANNDTIDDFTSCSCQAPNPNTFTMTTVTTTLVSKNFTPSITFRGTDVVSSNDSIRYSIPSDISFVNTSLFGMTITDVTSTTATLAIDNTNSNSSSNYYSIKPFTLNGKSYANANATFTLINAILLAPPSTKPSGSIIVSLYRNGAVYSTGTISITALSGALTGLTISADSQLVNAVTSFNISFTTASPLSSTGRFTIQLPSVITAPDSAAKSCQVSGSTNVSSSATCQITSGVVTITNALTGVLPANSLVSVHFSGVTNPESSATTGGFIITTLYDSSNNYAVDTSSSLTFKASADTITSLSVSSSSPVVGATAMYTVTYTLKNHLPIGGTLLIGIPLNMSLSNPSSAVVSISVGGGAAFSNTPSIISTSNGVYSSALNFTGLATSSKIAEGTVVVFNISSIVNPGSTKPSSSFSLYTYLQNSLIESLTSGVTVTMSSSASFTSAAASSNSKINGDLTSLILSFMPSVPLPVNGILKLTLPAEVSLASPMCSNLTASPASSLPCNLSGSILSITLSPTDPIATSVVYKYQISGFTNPRTMTTSGTFDLACYNSDGFYQVAHQTMAGITNSLPNYITSLTAQVITPTQSYLDSSQTILFNIVTKNALVATDYILLQYPSTYSYDGSAGSVCLEPTTTLTCTPQPNPLTVAVVGNFLNQTSFTFRVQSYHSPSLLQYINSPNYFMVYTMQANGNLIDITNTSQPSTQVGFTVSCNTNCKECSTPITNCTSCYGSTITNDQYLQNSVCVSNCTTGSYPDAASGSCKACVSPCSTCTSAAACLSCLATIPEKYYNSLSNTCVAICAQGYYGSIDVCTPCSSPCLNCSAISSNCTACNTLLYVLHNNNCIGSCPTGFFNSTGSCVACDVSCLTCVGLATNCSLCATGYVTNGTAGVCTNTCSLGSVPYNGACGCQVDCKSCSGSAGNCTTCEPASPFYAYYYSNQCLGSCPTGTYNSSMVCTTCPTGCSSCTSFTACQSCNATYFLYNGLCGTTCPASTYSSSGVCSPCTNNCATCTVLSSNCTSCNPTYALEGSVCKTSCSSGIPVSTTNGLECTACTSNCSTCAVSLSNCTACLVSSATSLYNNGCVSNCPPGTTSVAQVCADCSSPCLTCNITTSNCLSCRTGFYKVSQTSVNCVSDCSTVGLFLSGTDCTSCQSPCSTCSLLASNCTSCTSGSYLLGNACVSNCGGGFFAYQGNCLSSCPSGTVGSNGTCVDPNNNSTNNTNTTSNSTTSLNTTLTSSKIIPFPFFIADSVVIGLTLVSKFSSPQTSIACMGTSTGSLLEFASWAVVLVAVGLQESHLYLFKRLLFTVQTQTAQGVLCLLIAIALHYILNIVNFAFYLKYISSDEAYQRWLKTPSHSRIHKLTIAFSLLFTHKFSGMPFSKCFGSSCFKAPLSKPQLFTPLNIISGVSSSVSVIVIVGCALIVYDTTTLSMSSLFIQSIDSIIITSILLLLSLWNLRKPDDFFDEHSKLNTISDEIYNDTLAGMINNQSQFGERFSIDEAEEGKVGKRNYSRVKNDSKMSKESKVGALSGLRKKQLEGPDRVNESQEALNIHDMSSEYVSEQSDPNDQKKMEEFVRAQQVNLTNPQKKTDVATKITKADLKGKQADRTKKQSNTTKGVPTGKEDGKQKKSQKTRHMEVIKQGQEDHIEQEKSSSIIDKMRDSSQFAVQQEEGLEAGNPVQLDTKANKLPDKRNTREKIPKERQEKSKVGNKSHMEEAATLEGKSARTNGKSGKSKSKQKTNSEERSMKKEPSSLILKNNKISPMEVVPVESDSKQKKESHEQESNLSSEQRVHETQIDWNNSNGPEQSKQTKGKSRSPMKEDKQSKPKPTRKQKVTETGQGEPNSEQEKKPDEVDISSSQPQGRNPKVKHRSLSKDKTSIRDQEKSMPSGLKERGISPKKSNNSVKVKPKLKSDIEADRLGREKSLILKNAKPEVEQNPDKDEEQDQIGSINLDKALPNIPSKLKVDSQSEGYQSKTLNADERRGRKNKSNLQYNIENRKQAGMDEDLSSQHVFNALANTAVIKNLDASDQLPSKPRVMGKQHSHNTKEVPSNVTKIDSDFVNRYYVDDEELRSVEDANIEFNEISPSEFNIQNQRYDEAMDFPVPGTIKPNPTARQPEKPVRSGPATNANVSGIDLSQNEGLVSYYDTVSYKDSELDGGNHQNIPKGLSPERRQLPPLEGGNVFDRDADVYKSFSKLDSGGYDGVYQKMPENSDTQLQNRRRMRDLQKIYLQRLDFKSDSKRRSSNSAFNKKNFLDEN